MKNLIYMIAIDHHTSRFKNSSFSQYAIPTWEYWCKKNDVDFFVLKEHDERFGKPIWNKEAIFDRFGDKYDKIGIVDSDTMVRWDTPNIFNMYNDELCGVRDNDNFWWLDNSITHYQKFFPDVTIDSDYYVNAGVLFITKEHRNIFDGMMKFYFDNKEEIDNWTVPNTGREQTLLNFMIQKLNTKIKILPECWNMFGLQRKDLFSHNWQLGDTTPFFLKYGYIWHFTGMPIENRQQVMSQTWNMVKEKYV